MTDDPQMMKIDPATIGCTEEAVLRQFVPIPCWECSPRTNACQGCDCLCHDTSRQVAAANTIATMRHVIKSLGLTLERLQRELATARSGD